MKALFTTNDFVAEPNFAEENPPIPWMMYQLLHIICSHAAVGHVKNTVNRHPTEIADEQ